MAAQLVDERDEAGYRGLGGGTVHVVVDREAQRVLEADVALACDSVDALDGGRADVALGRVDDALEADLIGGVHDGLEVGHDVADLGAVEEARAPDDAVRHARAQQRVFELSRLRVGAVEDGEVGVAPVLGAQQPLDLRGDEAGLVALVAREVARDLLALGVGGEERLGLAVGVVGDDRVGGGEDARRRAVVLLELHHDGLRVVVLELEDVSQVRPAPRVDRLVVVAHDHEVAVAGREQVGDAVLRLVGVLILVDADEAEALLVGAQHRRELAEQPVGVEQQVVEVHRVGGLEPRLVAREDERRLLVHRRDGLGHELLGGHELVLRRGDPVLHAVDRVDLLVDLERTHDLFEHALGVVLVVDREVAREAEHLAVGPQHPHAHRVEREHPHRPHARSAELAEPLAHLARGLVGEGDREDLVRADPEVADEVRDAEREHARLATAGARKHEQRAVGGHDSFALRGVE